MDNSILDLEVCDITGGEALNLGKIKLNNKPIQYFVLPKASVTVRHIRPVENSHMLGAEDVYC
jgi:hypothetical protein